MNGEENTLRKFLIDCQKSYERGDVCDLKPSQISSIRSLSDDAQRTLLAILIFFDDSGERIPFQGYKLANGSLAWPLSKISPIARHAIAHTVESWRSS